MMIKKIILIIIVFTVFVIGFLSWNFFKSDLEQVNILVLGKSENLTDTLMVVSISTSKPSVNIISLPRDLWLPEIRAKINTAYHYGGSDLAKKSVTDVTGIPIHYWALLDFSGFTNIIDALGGIDVEVTTEFTDKLYPVAGKEDDPCLKCRYETLHFVQGKQLMNGEIALKFVRSRHAEGMEGTDIAREARQQKVISAIENKFMDPKIFLNPKKDIAMWKVVMGSIETDINNETGAVLARKAFDARNSINKYLIPEELLINPPISKLYDKQYVFIPKLGNGKWEDVHRWVVGMLN